MRIGLNTFFLIPGKVGGTETYARGLIKGLGKIDQENDYFIFCNQENYKTFNFESKNFKKIPSPVKASIRPFRILWEQFILPIQTWFQKIDVLLSLGYVCPLFISCKSIVVIYDLNWFFHPEEFSFPQRLAWKTLVSLSAKRADHIITSSQNSKKDIARILKISKEKISVVYGGIDRERFKPVGDKKKLLAIKKKYDIKDKFLLTVSVSYYFKNLGKLIDAFNIVVNDFPGLQLLVVGLSGRAKPKILEKIKKYHLGNRIIIAGWVPDEDLPLLYSAAQVYVHPSLYEGFGFPVLEAMACGCPVISSNSASLPELIKEGGLLMNAKKTEEIVKAIKKIIEDKDLQSLITIKGKKRSSYFSWIRVAKEVINEFNKI